MGETDRRRHLSCPFCGSYDVDRLFLGSVRADVCECAACGAGWEESHTSGRYRGRVGRASVITGDER